MGFWVIFHIDNQWNGDHSFSFGPSNLVFWLFLEENNSKKLWETKFAKFWFFADFCSFYEWKTLFFFSKNGIKTVKNGKNQNFANFVSHSFFELFTPRNSQKTRWLGPKLKEWSPFYWLSIWNMTQNPIKRP